MDNICRICLTTDNLHKIFPTREGMPNSNEIKLATGIEVIILIYGSFVNVPKLPNLSIFLVFKFVFLVYYFLWHSIMR
jgi:hypothetical protein